MLRFFSASSKNINSRKAIRECIEKALKKEPSLSCDLLIIYSSSGHNLTDLLSEARKTSGNARIVGCTGGGVISLDGPDESMKALAVLAIKGTPGEFAMAYRENIYDDPYKSAMEMAAELKRQAPGITMVQFHAPSISTVFKPVEKALEGIKAVFGKSIPVSGGLAFASLSNLEGGMSTSSYMFFDDKILSDGAVMIGYADPTLKFLNHANHGFDVLDGMTLEVTRSEKDIVYEINGQPSWKFLTSILAIPETFNPRQLLPITGFARMLPEELWEENGSKYLIYVVMGKNDDGSIFFPVSFPEGTKFWLTKRDEKRMFEGVDNIVNQITRELRGAKPEAVFQADCVLRGRFSVDRILKEEITARIQQPLCNGEKIPWLGYYSAGEFVMLGGESWFQQISTSLFVIYR